jgi:outer membrane protein
VRGLALAAFLAAVVVSAAATASAQAPAGPAQVPAADPGTPLSFDAALRGALDANTSVGRARAEVGAADAQRRTSLSYVLPRVGATGGLIRNSQEVTFGGADFERVILPQNDWNLRLTVQQPVFAGLREQRAYQQSKEGVRAAEQGVRATEDRILLRTASDYIQVVGGDELVKVEEQTLALARDRLREARDLFEAGETTRVDTLRAESSVKAAERRLALARRDRGVALGQLRIDLNRDGDFDVAEPSLSLPPRPDEALLLQRATETRGEVQQARSALRIAELEVSKQKGAYLPTVTADAGYVWQKTSFPTDRYGYAALRFAVPIWQSGEISSRVALARERERQAQLALEEQLRTVQEDVRRALLDLQTATTSLALSEDQLRAAEAEYQQVADLYRGQEATSLDIQSSETNLSEARRAVVVSRLTRLLSELGVYFAAGDLKSAVLKEAQP